MTDKKAVLTEKDYQDAAKELGCDVAVIKAVVEVEAPKGGFTAEGIPVGLFEAHYFSRLTGGIYDKSHPHLSSPEWNRELYGNQKEELERLEEASQLNRKAALQSFSWGKFQVMGENWRRLGYESLQAFVNAMYESERAHLDAFIRYCKYHHLEDELQSHNFGSFALKYNGPAAVKNQYPQKLSKAHAKFATEGKK